MARASKTSFQLTAIALALASIGAQGAPITWANDVSGNWTLPINWTPIGLPDSSSDVQITLTGVKTITHNLGADTISTLSFNATTSNPNATLLISSGSSLTVNNGGTNGSVIQADGMNSTMTFAGGTLTNNGTLNATNNGVIGISNATVSGGTLTSSSGGTIVLNNGAVLDGMTNGPITNTGSIVEADNATAYALGTIHNSGTISIGTTGADGTDLRIRNNNNLTVDGTGTTTLVNARIFGDSGSDVLTIGAGQTFDGRGNIGIGQMMVVNKGTIAADVSGQTLTLQPTGGQGNFVNSGTLEATGGGTLQLFTGTYTNNNLITAGTGSAVTITNGAAVQGGKVSTTGSGTVTLYGSSTLDGLTNGAITLTGNIAIGDNQTAYGLGTINDNTLTIGTTGANGTDFRIQNNNNLTLANNGTTTLINARIFGDNGNDLLTNTAGNTIQGYGNVGISQAYIANAGVITANVNGQTLVVDPSDGTTVAPGLINTGTMRAESGGTLQLLYGIYDNSAGTIQAKAGSTVTITNAANIIGGTVSTQGNGQVNLLNGMVLDGQTKGAITLTGNVAVGDNQAVYALGTVKDNTLTIGTTGANDTDLRIQGANNLTLANNGTTTLINARIFGDNGNDLLTNTAGNTIQGYGNVGISQAYIANAGVITSNVSGHTLTIDPSDGTSTAAGLTNTGTMRAENGGTLQLLYGFYDNSAGTITAATGSSLVITNGANILGGTVSTSGTGTAMVYNGAVLDGQTHGALTLSGNVTIGDNQAVYALGTIKDNTLTVGTTGANDTDLRIQGANNLTLANNGTTTLINARIFGDNGNDVLTNTAGNTIQGWGNVGNGQAYIANAGLITANVSGQTLTINPSGGTPTAAGLTNTSTISATNGGSLQIASGYYNNAGGTITAAAGSAVNIANGANIQGGTVSTSGTGAVTVYGAVLDGLTQGALTLTGNVAIADNQAAYALGTINDNTLKIGTTGADGTDLRIQGSNNLTLANGTTTLNNARIFGDNGNDLLTNAAGNTIQGVGSLGIGQMQLTNAGTINANVSGGTIALNTSSAVVNQTTGVLQASNGGTLNISQAVNGTGTIRSDSGGTVILNQASTTGQLINNGALQIAGLVTVSSDYNNANFGVGNAFNRNANVTGAGAIVASGDVGVGVIGANVTSLNPTASALTIGNVRVGANTYNYQVANTGTTGPAIRGAIQTQFSSGSGITDSRLSGTGVTPGNYGPVAAGATSGNFGVTFTAATAGTLAPLANSPGYGTGQAVFIADNFANVAGHVLQINLADGAAAYNVAVGSTTPTPATVANQRVNGSNTTALTVKNNGAAGSFTEALDAGFNGTTGAATTNGGSVSNIAAQASNNTALKVGVDTTTAGAKTGSVTIAYQTDGTGSNGHSGLSAISAGSQTINVSGNVYNTAIGMTTPTPVTVANQHVNGSNTSALTVMNNGAAGSFTEALDAGFSGTSGSATGTGSVSNIAAQASNSTALKVGVDTSTAGAKTGTVTIAYQTDGTGSNGNSGLAAIAAGSQNITVSGNVYNLAQSSTIGAINFGLHHVGDGIVSQTVAVTNTAPTGAFSEGLDSSFGAVTGTGASKITTSGVITNLAAGSTDSSTLVVKLDTSTVGMVNGNIRVNQASNGTIDGLANTALAGQNPAVTADVEQATGMTVRYASPKINTTTPVNFGAVRINTTQSTALSITNNVPNDGFSESLIANVTGSTGKGTGSGGFGAPTTVPALAPSATDTTHVLVGLNTATAGHQTGAVNVDFKSDGTAFAGGGITDLGTTAVGVQGDVYRLANATITQPTVLATRVGGGAQSKVNITNTSPDIYTEGLTATRGAITGPFSASGSITNLSAGQSTDAILVSLNATTAGTYTGSQALNLVSTGAGTDGAADMALTGQSIALVGKVYTQATATLNTPSANFGIVHVGQTVAAQNVSVTNSASVTALNDVLVGSAIGTNNAAFTAAGSLGAGLAAGATSANGALTVGLNTSTAGVYSGSASFSAASHDADLSDQALANLAVSLSGTVNNYASDAFAKSSGAGTFSQSGTTFVLDYGTVAQNSGVESTTLTAGNTATGPADVLSGSFSFLDPQDFNESGFSSFMDLVAGQSTGPLMFSFDTSTVGAFSDTIVLHGVGSNASGYEGAIGDITLTIRGNVTGQVVTPPGNPIPEPDTLVLLGLGVPLYFARRARKNAQVAKRA